ncbi:invasion associated locus B family protein [Rhodoplanes sp. TEM]|uniref:Invasion associated locus B family protein n=1 Tax=Rhodoplanes tepidamans TaxID=200616 RepID=A0ABT5JH06_RHOTP|nr:MULTISPECIES: invasion associated locus B family protein [Rhodoplanes]MDC7788864.1 invasion associated locus B family protein [Rhodoplanes tepidamans]MDC7986705.1 invasion associated locus B family protein [Rhodoplanes sp. TEM]MDQ0357841.1 invasion protein IalB [Rhodoplanes tepidamans]
MKLVLAFALAAVLPVSAAQAQAAQPAQSPQRTTATYDDWTVRCAVVDGAKSCEMAQAMQIKGQAQPVTQIAIGRLTKTDPIRIVFQVPINVWLPSGVKLAADDKDPGIVAGYRRCLPAACLAEAEIRDDVIRKLRALADNGKLQFKDGAQQDVAIPVSFKGFGQAYDAMLRP